jgi:hypothetical protein
MVTTFMHNAIHAQQSGKRRKRVCTHMPFVQPESIGKVTTGHKMVSEGW